MDAMLSAVWVSRRRLLAVRYGIIGRGGKMVPAAAAAGGRRAQAEIWKIESEEAAREETGE